MHTVISEECTSLAFYDLKARSSLELFYGIAQDWFASMGCHVDKGGVTGPGFGTRMVNFSRAAAKLRRDGFAGVTSIELVCTTPDCKFPLHDYLMCGSCDWEEHDSSAILSARSSIVPLTRLTLLPLAKEILHSLKPAYGYAFTRTACQAPTLYAYGIGTGEIYPRGSEAEKEKERLHWWCDANEAKPWKDGRIRDVYPWSFLTAPQLARPVGNVTLQEWILQNPRRGKLTAIDKKHVLWEVEERMIRPLRKPLEKAGVIYFGWSNEEE